MPRVLIDPSALVRVLLESDNPARAVDVMMAAAVAGAFELLLPPEVLAELADQLTHDPYLAARVSPKRREAFFALLAEVGTPVYPYLRPFPPATRDPKDDYLIAYALRDRVDFLVTGDRDLLVLAADYDPPAILDPGAFVRELRARGML